MANVAIRASWTGSQSGNSRHIYFDTVTVAGDYLVVFQFKSSNTSITETYDYDSGGTPEQMTKIG